jgi:hypothetical protein
MARDTRREYDDLLENARAVDPVRPVEPPRRKRVPSWYKGDAEAAASSMLAARQLGLRPVG